jgi:tetratricopeptide (TPR) repeat protein
MFLAGSRQQPLIIVIEELQWLDDTSRQWLTSLIHSLANAPLLVLTTYRPGYCPPWGTMAQTSEMIITPLPTQPTLEMPPATPPTRQVLHDAAARALEAHVETAEAPEAIRALTQVAAQAIAHGAHVEALSACQEALKQVARLPHAEQPQHRAPLVLRQAHSLVALGRFQETVDLLQPLPAQVAALRGTSLVGRWALLLSQALSHLSAWDRAVQSAHDAIAAIMPGEDDVTRGQAYHVLAMACYWSEDPVAGIAYGRQALSLLEPSVEHAALNMAYIVQGLNALLYGDFALALEAVARADTLARRLDDPSLQAYTAWLTGWVQATRGAWDEGIVACRRSLALAIEPLHTAFAQGWLGYAHLELGDPAAAIPLLEQAIQQMHVHCYQRCAGLFTTLLAAAHLRQGHLDTAHALGQQGLTISRAASHRLGSGWAQRVLGQVAQAAGASAEAWRYGQEALATFSALPARFEVGRTHLALGEIAQAQDQHEAACQHVTEAHRLFQTLDVRPFAERAAQQAHALGFALPPAVDSH